MNKIDSKIFVVGDSHVRAFGFHKSFFPLFIGPAAFNNFKTEKSSDLVSRKLELILEGFSSNIIYLILLFNGDVIHTARGKKDISEDDVSHLKIAANRFSKIITKIISLNPENQILIGATLPGTDKVYKYYQEVYNNEMRLLAEKKHFEIFDVNKNLTNSSGFLLSKFRADFAHINYKVADHFANVLINNKWDIKKEENSNYRWKNVISINRKNCEIKVWGGVYRDQLITEDHETLPLSDFERNSNLLRKILFEVITFCKKKLDTSLISIGNCGEGFLLIEATSVFDGPIFGFDCDSTRIENANLLLKIHGTEKVKIVQRKFGNPLNKYFGIVLDFEQFRFKEQNRLELLNEYRLNSDYVFLLSKNLKSDSRILQKAGYKYWGNFFVAEDNFSVIWASCSNISTKTVSYNYFRKFQRKVLLPLLSVRGKIG